VLTGYGDILCIQMHDQNYFVKPAFPQEEAIVCCDSLLFECMFYVDDKGIHRRVNEAEYLMLEKCYPNSIIHKKHDPNDIEIDDPLMKQ